MIEFLQHITTAPILSDNSRIVVYRDNGEEIEVKLNRETKTIESKTKLHENEVRFIKENYL